MQTTRLRELIAAEGPYASVYFEDSHDTADAAKRLELTWRDLRERLAEQGASVPTLDALAEAVRQGTPPVGRSGRAMIAANGEVLLDRHLPTPPTGTVTRYSALPYLLPLVEYGEPAPVHIVAVVDSMGADLTAFAADGTVLSTETTQGSEHPVHAVTHAGEIRRHMEERVEETVKQNLRLVAEDINKLAQRVGAELVVLAGEVQGRSALHEELPEQTRRLAVEVSSGSRQDGVADSDLRKHVHELLEHARQERLDDAVRRFRAESGRDGGLSVQGLQATTTALREANVAMLLVDPAAQDSEATVAVGPGPEQVAPQQEELTAIGAETPVTGRADEALAVAAIATGAEIVHTGDRLELMDGFGAVLRHD
ncbi:Vms1/Ankzf1 family peptidyl-tRNA hydrolase [Amycolatopsis cihanbeyliensis]|uniref:Peptide subunit release factor 1 (ERF1) n=1 Tax=Amycolatopsis cihanbeyliensis TaxID=1128664 RepID=A0A542DME8_AMYCI|nr:Vms1/Ankzf1 family peptidyl-tRNA hydrolase [Amycolatopsis cihanbeyliensis]TQJ04258.1 hypothetical protein FB471_4041 [Amycolatopsis cihanbeyliensis]